MTQCGGVSEAMCNHVRWTQSKVVAITSHNTCQTKRWTVPMDETHYKRGTQTQSPMRLSPAETAETDANTLADALHEWHSLIVSSMVSRRHSLTRSSMVSWMRWVRQSSRQSWWLTGSGYTRARSNKHRTRAHSRGKARSQ